MDESARKSRYGAGMGWIKGALKRAGDWATKIESWLALWGMALSSGAFSWIAAQWDLLAGEGWAAVALTGIAAASLFVIALAALASLVVRIKQWASSSTPPTAIAFHQGETANEAAGSDAEVYEGAHETLMLFVVDHLLPTCDAQDMCQHYLIMALCDSDEIKSLALSGLSGNYRIQKFKEAYGDLSMISGSPTEFVPLEKMIEAVHTIETEYYKFIEFGGRLIALARSRNMINNDIFDSWNEWRASHDKMIAAYESIRRESRLGRLFRPGRPSRWTGPGLLERYSDLRATNQLPS